MAMNKSLGEMLRFVSRDESQALQDICEYNEISEEGLQSPENITTLEMFLFNFPQICCLNFFPNLKSLSLVQQNLKLIQGLHCLPHLEILRLSENEIQRIEGLSNCLKLKQIFLQNNSISKITNLSHLNNLQVLWLANNFIKCVEGLDNLPIEELNLAKNPISQLGNILKLKTLSYLNVSSTDIGSFKEIRNLSRLKNLKDLRFYDPHWGPSPLALLHNYQTYILFRLQDLGRLDTVDLTDEAKQLAKVTYTRKRVYYNLCIKSLQKSREKVKFVTESNHIEDHQKDLAECIKRARDRERILPAVNDFHTSNDVIEEHLGAPTEQKSHGQMKANIMTHQIFLKLRKLDYVTKDLRLLKAREHAAIDLSIHWLMAELDSGGNIRMESGNPKDVWYKSCVDLVTSRFFADDYTHLGIIGINVMKVTRIHNRFLQDRFEKRHEQQMLKSGNKNVEYLLCGEGLQIHDELQSIIEGGFPLWSNQNTYGPTAGPIVLSNSVGLADCYRLKVIAENLPMNISSGATRGWILVVKTCLGTSVRDVRCKYTQLPGRGISDGNANNEEWCLGAAKKLYYSHADSVYRSHPSDSKQRSWFIFDAAVVVPEYLVEFEYCLDNKSQSHHGYLHCPMDSSIGTRDNIFLGCESEDLFSCADQDLGPSTESTKIFCSPSMSNCMDESTTIIQVEPSSSATSTSTVSCNSDPEMPIEHIKLSLDFILHRIHIYDVLDISSVTYLNLHDSNIGSMESLSGLHSLKILILCFNKISRIEGINDLAQLESLDLSYNIITRIEGMDCIVSLTTLNLGGNKICDPNDLLLLQNEVPRLTSLNLRANPVVEDLDYPGMVFRIFPHLAELDNHLISAEERMEANRKYIISPALLFSNPIREWGYLLPSLSTTYHSTKDLQDKKCFEDLQCSSEEDAQKESLVPEAAKSTLRDPISYKNEYLLKRLDNPFRHNPYNTSIWNFKVFPTNMLLGSNTSDRGKACKQEVNDGLLYNGVEEVHLEGQNLKSMHCFDKLANLRRLFLSGNKISVIEGLDECSILEELLLGKNNIKQVERLKHVESLWRLDLSHNKLACCGRFDSFRALEQLSIDSNEIKSLKGLDILTSLMELYAANNLLVDMGELNYIKNLPKLIVVDLCGNALCENCDYRMYAIYSLRKLKVLDGRNVETNEIMLSRNKYLGRLTQDMLEKCLDDCEISKVEVLDLSGQKLRSCGEVFESLELGGLKQLILKDNILSSIHALRFLRNLKLLNLENNKFEDKSLFAPSSDHLLEIKCIDHDSDLTMIEVEVDHGKNFMPTSCLSDDGEDWLQLLEVLKLGGNSITTISSLCLYKFPNLKLLALQDNRIAKVDGLEGLKSLENLYLDHNEIKEIEAFSFAQLENLKVLSLSNNGVKTLFHLNGLISLETLDLSYNQIAPNRMGGVASIDNLSRLSQLSKLSFTNNPISRQNLYRISVISRLPQLGCLDDREITSEERQEASQYPPANKESNHIFTDSNTFSDYQANGSFSSGATQLKIPLKVTSLNFENMCLQQSPRGTYQVSNPGKSRVTLYNYVPHLAAVKSSCGWDGNGNGDDPKPQSQSPGLLSRLDKIQPYGQQHLPLPIAKGKGKSENKVIMIPYSTSAKSISPSKDCKWAQKTSGQF